MPAKRIEVTKEDIKKATARKLAGELAYNPFQECLIATTFKRVFPRASKKHLYVGFSRAEVGSRAFELPKKVQDKIEAFIEGKQVKPFIFNLPPGKRI